MVLPACMLINEAGETTPHSLVSASRVTLASRLAAGEDAGMRLTFRFNRATLDRQLLLRRERLRCRRRSAGWAAAGAGAGLAVPGAVDPADGFDPADLDVAFADTSVVKPTLMRITLHAVVAADYPTVQRRRV